MIPISKPCIGENEQRAVQRVLASGGLAQGPRVAEFERAFAEYIGVKHAIATSNGTTALHVALLAHGIGAGAEVITTPFTFIASINAILYAGATPRLVDVDDSFNLDASQIENAITPRTKAILPIHLFGQPCDLRAVMGLATRHNLVVVEDACQAHGATFQGKRAGSFGMGCFSFYATKNMTTGEGGMLTTSDDAVAAHARLLINHGMRVRYHHETLGYNFRLTDVAAAIGIEQLKQLDGFNARRAENAAYYDEHLRNVRGMVVPRVFPQRTHVYHQYTVRVLPDFPLTREELIARLSERGIGVGVYYPIPAHQQESASHNEWAQVHLPRAQEFAKQVISLPVHPLVTDADRAYIVETIRELANRG
ncbi:MAG: DegT/DnrJ/EryC1/StrS family aminotransferase [Chloroflexi bacterium]|nr:DegT/DnrJ/EryC1/StrS family aminotransferase [Chloroflexota bacterium]